MRKFIMVGSVLLTVCVLSGCGASADSLMKDQIRDMNAMADALEKKDDAKAKEIEKSMKATEEKLNALKLSEDEKKKVVERHKDEITKAMDRLMKASMGRAMEGFGKGAPVGFPGISK